MGFFDSFLGKSQARDARMGAERANSQLGAGFADATQQITQGRDRALNQLTPYMQQGGAGNRMYGDALGLGGADAQRAAFGTYSGSPFLEAQRGASANALTALFRKYNAGGLGNSGASRLAVSRVAQDREAANQGDWLNRLQGVGQQGAQFAGQAAGLEQGTGQYLADLGYGFRNQLAGNEINLANNIAGSRNTGVNNLMGLLGTGVNAYTTFNRPRP